MRFFGNWRIGPSSTGGLPGAAASRLALSEAVGAAGFVSTLDFVLDLALALRLFVESKPVSPAADGGDVKTAGGPSCTSSGRGNFWKRGGLRGSVARFGASGPGGGGDAVCASASAVINATLTAMSRRAPRSAAWRRERRRSTIVSTFPPTEKRRADAPFQKERSPAGPQALVNGS